MCTSDIMFKFELTKELEEKVNNCIDTWILTYLKYSLLMEEGERYYEPEECVSK